MNNELQQNAPTPNIIIDNKNNSTKYIVGGVLIILLAVGVFVWWKFYYQKSKAATERNDLDPQTNNGKAKLYANRVYDAFSWYNNNEAELLSVAQQAATDGITYKQLADAFKATRNENLDSYLSRLNVPDKNKFMEAFTNQKVTAETTKLSPVTLSKDGEQAKIVAKTIANELTNEFKKAYSSTSSILAIIQKIKSKGDWYLVYSTFGVRTHNFRNMDLTNHIRSIYPSGKKEIFADLNKRLGTQLS